MNEITKARKLIEASLMIAIATALSLLKLMELPYGGAVTMASMLPIVIIACRNGVGWGLASGAIFGGIQQLLGLKVLSWVTTWYSILAVIILDYVIAFAVIGFAGAFRKLEKQNNALALGAFFACFLRYVCHVISGATVWAGLSIPTSAATLYSLGYNATYMIPETIVLVIAAYYIGSMLDFRTVQPVRLVREANGGGGAYKLIGWLLIAAAVVFDVVSVFGKLQNAETGEFDFAGISALTCGEITAMACVTVGAAVIAGVLFVIAAKKKKTTVVSRPEE